MSVPLRVGLVADYLEEGWPSMDLVAEMLATYLPLADPGITVETLRPRFVRRLGRLLPPGASGERTRDRVLNRFWDYPRWLASRAARFDVMHVVDHSYAHLVHKTAPVPCLVTLHDLDAFRSLLGEEDGGLPTRLVRHQLTGLQRADAVVCVSDAVRQQLEASGLLPGRRVEVVANGVHPSCSPEPDAHADRRIAGLLGAPGERIELLHVGSVIPRKRIDVLLRVLARVARGHASVRLVRVGGPLTAGQQADAAALGVSDRVVSLPHLDRRDLAAVYRRASLLLLPSEREGFGLPVVEALACGTPAVLSDLPVLREVAGHAASYAPVGDVDAWSACVDTLLGQQRSPDARLARRACALGVASRYSWPASAGRYAAQYRTLLNAAGAGAVA